MPRSRPEPKMAIEKEITKKKATKKVTKKKTTTKKKMGRPTTYREEFCQMLIEHMEQGFSFESFAGVAGTTIETLREWSNPNKDNHQPNFVLAKALGFPKCQYFWEDVGIKGTKGHYKNFSAPAYIFNMKNRFKWTDRTDLAVQIDDKISDQQKHEQLKAIDRKQLIKLVKVS